MLVGGGLFGFVGMVIGIPVFAVIYAYVSRGINGRLEKRGLETDLREYKVDNYTVKRRSKTTTGKSKWRIRKGGNDR